MNYPTALGVVIKDECVIFQNGINLLEIHADKTVWQEDSEVCGGYNEQTGKLEFWEAPVQSPREQGDRLQPAPCHCGGVWDPTPGCCSLTNEQIFVHLQADHLAVFTDYELDYPLLFEMIDPTIMSAVRSKVGELLGIAVPLHNLSSDQLEARLAEYKQKTAAGALSFSFGTQDVKLSLKPI
jgi:hypothetical protein